MLSSMPLVLRRAAQLDFRRPQHEGNAKELNWSPIRPAEDSFFISSHNRLPSGTLASNVAIDMEVIGISLPDHHSSVSVLVHLYNACQRLRATQGKWLEMDRASGFCKEQIF